MPGSCIRKHGGNLTASECYVFITSMYIWIVELVARYKMYIFVSTTQIQKYPNQRESSSIVHTDSENYK